MGFMRPIAEKMTMYCVDTNAGIYNVPADALSVEDFDARGRVRRRVGRAFMDFGKGK